MKLPVVILAGGKGERVKLICKNLPKVLLPINNVPFIIILINFFIKQGYNKFYVLTGYRSSMIENAIKKYDLKNIKILKDGKKLKGTGGAIKKSLNIIREDFFLIYGDTFLPIKFASIEKYYNKKKRRKTLLTIYKNNNKLDKSNVKILNNNKSILYDKDSKTRMNYIDYGLSIIKYKDYLKFCKNKRYSFDLKEYYKFISINDRMDYKIVKKPFYEIGSYLGISKTKKFIKKWNLSQII
jgi:MurNAc alpha-1-phosphate uridylyltransferase